MDGDDDEGGLVRERSPPASTSISLLQDRFATLADALFCPARRSGLGRARLRYSGLAAAARQGGRRNGDIAPIFSLSALCRARQAAAMTPLPIVVIGGGVAGAAVGAQLAQAGKPVVIIERRKGPHHKICGEFISAEAADYLNELNIDLPSLGACRIKSVRLCAGEHMVAADLPFPAFSLSRFVLDEALLRRAQAFGAQVVRGQSVHSLQADDKHWIVELEDGHCLAAKDAFLANGKHDVRGWKRPAKRESNFVAFKLHWRLCDEQTAALRGNVELFLFAGGYAGLELVEDGIANLCLIVERARFAALGQRWDAVLDLLRTDCPLLAQRLRNATPSWERPLAMTSIP